MAAKRRKAAQTKKIGKSTTIPIRVSPEEKERWQAAATADRRTLSDWLRIAADDKAATSSG